MNSEEKSFKELISTHLGKSGDGSLVKPYVTPEKHDASLLVPIPREYNRLKNDITSKFVGYEVWHAYEMSFLTQSGMPSTGILKIAYSSDSFSMVESKSLKLYLNSFDLEKFSSVKEVEDIIKKDLSTLLKDDVLVTLHEAQHIKVDNLPSIFSYNFENVDDKNFNIESYKEDSNLLDEDVPGFLSFHTANLRSLCEITAQKDTGNCYIYIDSDYALPSLKSLTQYIISLRDSQHFHENVTEIVFDNLNKKYKPKHLLVANLYQRRGGCDIHSVRATSELTLNLLIPNYNNSDKLFQKTAQS